MYQLTSRESRSSRSLLLFAHPSNSSRRSVWQMQRKHPRWTYLNHHRKYLLTVAFTQSRLKLNIYHSDSLISLVRETGFVSEWFFYVDYYGTSIVPCYYPKSSGHEQKERRSVSFVLLISPLLHTVWLYMSYIHTDSFSPLRHFTRWHYLLLYLLDDSVILLPSRLNALRALPCVLTVQGVT